MKVASPAKLLVGYCRIVDSISENLGNILGWLILVLTGMLCWEVLLRYFFNAPTIWADEGSTYVFALYFALGGAYALKKGIMVNVDIIVNKLTPRTRAIIDIITGLTALFFIGFLTWKSWQLTLVSIANNERSVTQFAGPIYMLKTFIFLGALAMGLQLVSELFRRILFLSGEVQTK